VYSGDTEPCDNLVRDGEGADLLIHEATFEPEMIQDARRKRHSTLEEAVDVSDRMNASRTVLTHFSQRYPKFPTGFPQKGSKVGIAFDGFCLPFKLIDSFPKYMTFFQQMLTYGED
jgi:ribonuclease Z